MQGYQFFSINQSESSIKILVRSKDFSPLMRAINRLLQTLLVLQNIT